MKLYELDSSIHGIENVYETIKRDCMPYANMVGGMKRIWKLPYRDISRSLLPSSFYSDPLLAKIDTQPERKSLATGDLSYQIVENTLVSNGYASRIKHAFFTSSTGANYDYGVNKNAPRVIPIGEFTFSYAPGDFNYITGVSYDNIMSSLVKHSIKFYDLKMEDVKSSTITDIIELVESITPEDLDAMYYPYATQRNLLEELNDIRHALNQVKSDDLNNAFKEENELWFNSKSYYAMSKDTYIDLVEYMRNNGLY